MNCKKLRLGIVGAGGMTAYHIPGFRKGGAEVAAIADLNAAAAQACAAKWGVKATYGSLGEMLQHERLDAVSIITPNKFHCPLVLEALAAGMHVFCEKPPALNAKEAMKMRAAAQKADRHLLFNFCNRARPEAQAIMSEIRSGKIGHINSAQAMWVRRTGIPGFGGWFTTKALSGGGPVIDLLHGIDLALWFMGYPEPEYVLARTYDDHITDKTFRGPWGIPEKRNGVCDVEAAAYGFVTFKDGSSMTLRNSWAEMIKREEMSVVLQGVNEGAYIRRVFGQDGIDETAVDTAEFIRHDRRGKRCDVAVTKRRDEAMGRIRAATNFVRVLQGEEEPLSNPDEAVRLMKIIDAIYASSKLRRPIRLH